MRHTINNTVINTPTGIAGSSDGVMLMVIKGVSTSTLVLDTAYLCSKIADLATLGITPDYDYINSLSVYQQASEFYKEAGDGAYLWLVVTSTATVYNTYVAGSTFQNLIRGTMVADPTKRAKMVGICFAPPSTTQSAADFSSEVLSTLTALQATQVAMFPEGFSWSAIIDGYNMSSTATATSIQSMATKLAPSVSLAITGSMPNGVAAVGAALGRFSRISVGHGFGAVGDGPISLQTAYLTNGTSVPILGTTIAQGTNLTAGHSYMVVNGPVTYNGQAYSVGQIFTVLTGTLGFTGTSTTVVDLTTAGTITASSQYYVLFGPVTNNGVEYPTGSVFTAVGTSFTGGIVALYNSTNVTKLFASDINAFGDKQYMFIRTWFNQPGLYWNDGATCDLSTKPLSSQEFNRIANALASDVLTFLTPAVMGASNPIDPKTNAVSSTYTKTLEQAFYTQYIVPLITPVAPNVAGDISDGSLVLSGVKNGATVVNWTFTLTITANGITGSVTGTTQFV